MRGIATEPSVPSTWKSRTAVAAALALVYFGAPYPAQWLRERARELFGRPAYQSWWGLVEHALLYTTLAALLVVLLWPLLASRGWMERLRPVFALPKRRDWLLTLGMTVALCAFNLGAFVAMGGKLNPHAVSPWIMAGNLFSNFYEELIGRGFQLSGLLAILGGHRWLAILLNAFLFAASHEQYPLTLKLLVGTGGAMLAWLTVRTRSIWPAYVAHQLGDLILDPLM